MSRVVNSNWLFALALICALTGSWWAETINLSLSPSGGPDEGVYLGAARLLNHGYAFSSFFFDHFALFPQILALALRLGGEAAVDAMVVFRSDCLIPPTAINLSYASTFQFFAGSQQRLEESVHDYDVKAFVVLGSYKADLKLMQWIAANYPLAQTAGEKGSAGPANTFWRE